jgi:hypothetical protein
MFRRCEVLASKKAHLLKYGPSLGAADWRFCVNQVLACALQAVDADADVVEYKGVQRLLVGRLFREDAAPAPDDTMQLGGRRQAAQGVQAHVGGWFIEVEFRRFRQGSSERVEVSA